MAKLGIGDVKIDKKIGIIKGKYNGPILGHMVLNEEKRELQDIAMKFYDLGFTQSKIDIKIDFVITPVKGK